MVYIKHKIKIELSGSTDATFRTFNQSHRTATAWLDWLNVRKASAPENLEWSRLPGKSLSEALNLASVNPQYDKRLFIIGKKTSSQYVAHKFLF